MPWSEQKGTESTMGNAGKKIRNPDDLGEPLYDAAKQGNGNQVQKLLVAGAPVNWTHTNHLFKGRTALYAAACYGHLDIVRMLVEAGAEPGIPNAQGETAVQGANRMANHDVVQFLNQHASRTVRPQQQQQQQQQQQSDFGAQRAAAAAQTALAAENAQREAARLRQAAQEAASRENAAREQASRDQAAKDNAAKQQQAKDLQAKAAATALRDKPLSSWSTTDARLWLTSMGKAFESQADKFDDNGIDGNALAAYSDFTDFQSIGFNQGHSKQLSGALQSLKDGQTGTGGKAGSPPGSPRGLKPVDTEAPPYESPMPSPGRSQSPNSQSPIAVVPGDSISSAFASACTVALNARNKTADDEELVALDHVVGICKARFAKCKKGIAKQDKTEWESYEPGEPPEIPNISDTELIKTASVGAGVGGMAMLCDWKPLGGEQQRVVMKIPHNRVEFMLEAEREARLWATCPRHPNVAPMLGRVVDKDGKFQGILMEYFTEGALEKMSRKLSSSDLLGMVTQLARGLQHLQALKIVHRDLAPRNVLVNYDRRVAITDFGLSRAKTTETSYETVSKIALPWRSLAPELLRARSEGKAMHFTDKTDVWAFGIMMWELATTESAYSDQVQRDQTYQAIASGQIRLDLTRLFAYPEILPAAAGCLELDPAKRPSAVELLMILGDDPVMARKCKDEYLLRLSHGNYG